MSNEPPMRRPDGAFWIGTVRDWAPPELLAAAAEHFGGRIALASSFSAEDQVLLHMIVSSQVRIPVFTLDTGRLPEQTYALIARTRERYGVEVRVYFPDAAAVEEMVSREGPNLFYESREARLRCCQVRKVAPLKRALHGLEAWICGLRRAQGPTRQAIEPVSWDEAHGMVKICPLATWSDEQVWNFIREHQAPYHPLHDEGYPSIGCAPCTRAVASGADPRSGRWWWEEPEHKECGLHARHERATPPDSPRSLDDS